MIERIVYANADNFDFPIRVSSGPDWLADPRDAVCLQVPLNDIYIDKAQWYELVRAVDQWFADAEIQEKGRKEAER